VNYNTDISQYWEWSGRGLRPFDETNEAYKLGVNYIIYGLTHCRAGRQRPLPRSGRSGQCRSYVIVRTLFENCVGNCCSDDTAGPRTTTPFVLKREPWQGQTNSWLSKPVIVHVSCVQIAVIAVNEFWAVWATRKFPTLACTRAALPTAASGDAASIVTVTAPFTTGAFTEGSEGAEDGDVGLPPHP
jgi:hypothetical protein